MVDIHCHILPGVDDGPRSWKVAIQMGKMASEDGIEHIVASPHANRRFPYDRAALATLIEELRRQMGGRPELSLGCDFHLSYENYLALLDNPSRFTIGNTPYLLVELDDYSLPASLSDNLEELILKGLVPIITHPERNPLLREDLSRVLKWVELGCLVQVTADSLTGRWGPLARSAVEWLIKHKAIHVIATDAHGVSSRPPILSKAWRELVALSDEFLARALAIENPLAIVRGEKLPHCPVPVSI